MIDIKKRIGFGEHNKAGWSRSPRNKATHTHKHTGLLKFLPLFAFNSCYLERWPREMLIPKRKKQILKIYNIFHVAPKLII